MNKKTLSMCRAALIAALYVALTYVSAMAGLASGAVQIRLSEALTVLPYFTAAAVPGLTVGCFAANLLFGASAYDIIFGTAATLIGAVGARLLHRWRWLTPAPAIIANSLAIPLVLHFSGLTKEGLPFMILTVGIGELISAGVIGILLLFSLERYGKRLFK